MTTTARLFIARGLLGLSVMGASCPGAPGQAEQSPKPPAAAAEASDSTDRTAAAVKRCVEFLVSAQEGDDQAEWPYEGVYRVRGKIPIGYRIGGTSIVSVALLRAPGLSDDAPRREAIERGLRFVISRLDDPLMNPDYDGGYDVRGWGYTYALRFLLAIRTASTDDLRLIPDELRATVDAKIRWCIDAIQRTEIPEAGGWNYARGRGKGAVSPPSPFMTGPTLQALFEARRQGFEVEPAVVDRGLAALERGRSNTGSVSYSGDAAKRPDPVPGSVGRMLISEITLSLAGRSDLSRVRGALDAFFVHWDRLDERRARPGTHEGPYGVAPYYFYYAHEQAALAIEMLPRRERAEYRRKLHDRLFSVRQESGTWNDRVFERTANYGTSQALMCLLAPDLPEPAAWK